MSDTKSKWQKKLLKVVNRHVPISSWILKYTLEDLICDIIAGVTISLTIIPQSIAYAALANLDPQYGLNSAFAGCLLYVFFGNVKEVVIGPSSLMSLLTYEYTSELNVDFVILLCFICGIVEFFMAVLHLGFLIGFLSVPVISGFTTATSIIIIVAQLKGLIGVNFKSHGFVDNIYKLYENAKSLKAGDTILGVASIVFLLSLRKLKDINLPNKTPYRHIVKKTFWFISTGRNAFVVFIGSCISYYYKNNGINTPFITTKSVDSGIPTWTLPPMSTQINNQTYNLPEMVFELGSGCIILPIISIFANVAIAKAFANGSLDGTQEMLVLALSNVVGSFFQSMPTAGAFTRSAVISSSGVRTPLAGLFSATLTLLALKFLGPHFHYIPRSTLSAVLIAAILFLIDWQIVLPLWSKNKLDLLTLVVSLVASLCLGVEIGLLFGVVVGVANLIYKWARPKITVEQNNNFSCSCVVLTPNLDLYFPSVDYLTSLVLNNIDKNAVVVDCRNMKGTDYSVAKNMAILSNNLKKRGQQLLFLEGKQSIKEMWMLAGCDERQFINDNNFEMAVIGDNHESLLPLLHNVNKVDSPKEK